MTDKESLHGPSPEEENRPHDSASVPPEDDSSGGAGDSYEADGEDRAYPSIFDKPDHSRYKEAKKRKVSRGARNIILSLVLCLALAGGIFAIYRYLPQAEEPVASTGAVLSLFDYTKYITYDSALTDTEGVKTVDVSNAEGSFQITYSIVDKVQQNSVTGEDETVKAIGWDVAGYDKVAFDSDTLQYLVGDLLKVIYTGVYTPDASSVNGEGVVYRSECGLDNPQATLTVTFNDGKAYTIYIGNEIPTKGAYYLMQEGDNAIYISQESDVSYFLRGVTYYVSSQIVPVFDQKKIADEYFADGTLSRFDKITVSGSAYNKPLVFEMADSSQIAVPTDYRMTSPEARAADTEKIASLLAPLANGLQGNQCLVMQATDADRKSYGLDRPVCRVSYEIEGKTYVITVGKEVENGYYAVGYSGSDSIFKAASSSVSFAFRTAEDYRSALLYVTDITDVSSMEVAAVNESGELITETFTLHHMTSQTTSGGTTNSLTVSDAKGNMINEGDFREFYKGVISMTASQFVEDGKQADTPRLTVTLHYNDSAKTDVIRLSEYSGRRYFYTLNGKGDAVVLASTVETVLGYFSALLK